MPVMILILDPLQMYEPVTEGSYIKLIDMVRGQGGHMQVSLCSPSAGPLVHGDWISVASFIS